MANSERDGSGEIFLIDGNSLAYRAFFALPESITTKDGRPTNAIQGWVGMMARIIDDFNPRSVIVAWDAGLSGREEVYAEYKAQRPPKPESLSEQWPHLVSFAKAFGFTNVRVDGYEADDIIGTLAAQGRAADAPVMIVSGDRDVYQLVGGSVRVMSTGRGVTDVKIYDSAGVEERYGVPPDRVTDMMAMRGDTSDNIPGVPGVGEKTAAALVQEFGDLETILASIDKISGPKRKQNLTENADLARVSKQLATIQTDVEMPDELASIDTLPPLQPDRDALDALLDQFEFRTLRNRLDGLLGGLAKSAPAAAPEVEAVRIQPVETALSDVQTEAGRRWALAADSGRWALVSGDDVLIGSHDGGEELGSALKDFEIVAHDAKSILTGSVFPQLVHDTMIGAYLIDASRREYDLAEMAAEADLAVVAVDGDGNVISQEDTDSSDAGDEGELTLDLDGVDEDEGAHERADSAPTLAVQAKLVVGLTAIQRQQMAELGLEQLFDDVELPLVEILARMERLGVGFDVERLTEIGADMEGRIAALAAEIHALAGREFTIGSPQQLSVVLFEDLGLPKGRKGRTGYSTDARVLAKIRDKHEIVDKIEQWRELTKLKNTYLDALPGDVAEDGRIHTTFNQVRAATGRLSSINPNLQNIPIRSDIGRPVRGCFVAREGWQLLSADYNQVELRVLAHVAEEQSLRDIFASGEDIHTATAAEVLGLDPDDVGSSERSKAKMVNYGIVYGLSAFGLADRLSIGRVEAAGYIEAYFARFPGIRGFMEEVAAQALKDGYVTTVLGRRRAIPELKSSSHQQRQLGERLAVNTVVQGSAADIIKLAMVDAQRALDEAGGQSRLILQIHDELLFEGPPDEMDDLRKLAISTMTDAFPLDPPLAVDVGVGPNWLEAK